jgi:predicted RNase H-like HicB family nuclease
MKYAVVIESGRKNYSAYVPDLPGCVSTGRTLEEVERNIKEAIEFHLEGLREDGEPVPPPSTLCEYVDLTVAETQ